MTLRQASSKVRKLLSPHPQASKIRGKTVSFAGFGYDSAGFIDIECDSPLPEEAILISQDAKTEFQSEDNKFIVSLSGFAYPFGKKV
jgi:TATA-binding protein-associated factor Taf7